MKKLLVLPAAAMLLSGCLENSYNAAPSIFPPIEGPATLPSQAQGYYQGNGGEFLRQLSDGEQEIFDALSPAAKARAILFIRNGGTLRSSLGSDT